MKDGAAPGKKPLEASNADAPQSASSSGAHRVIQRDADEAATKTLPGEAGRLTQVLADLAQKTGSARDLPQLFSSVHEVVGLVMDARNFQVAIYDPERQLLSFPYFRDEVTHAPEPKRLERGLVDHVVRTGKPVLATPEVSRQLMKQRAVDPSGERAVHWMGVPLKSLGHTFGALVVQRYEKESPIDAHDLALLTLVAQQVAGAIQYRRNEQRLRESEARYRSLVQSAAHGIYRAELDGKFLDVNPALVAMLGYVSSADLLALEARELFASAPEWEQLRGDLRQTGRVARVEVQWKRKQGDTLTVRISAQAVTRGGDGSQIVEAIVEDITDRRVLEEQFRQAQKMEAVGRLAGGIAHDFNNLLMVISGYSETLIEQLGPSHSLSGKAEAIQQATDRATTLTRQLLAFSRKQVLDLKVVDVNAIVKDLEQLLRPLIGEDIELVTLLNAENSCARADAGQLEQVLMNLVVNARDAMPGGGKLIIETGNVVLDQPRPGEQSVIQPGRYIMLSVKDSGSGMSKETLSRVFEPFFTTKDKSKGTGLGLSTVYGIVKQSGGYIFVESEPGRGTEFSIYLPWLEHRAEVKKKVRPATSRSHCEETVLLVEDEESVRELVRETLESKGYRLLLAENGVAGIERASAFEEKIDLLITDVVMPGMGGQELANRLVVQRPGIKVLFLSGYTGDQLLGPEQSEKCFLQKPFTLQALAGKVREVLETSV
jgi:two-component system, cell cycle sensor histidine kinase and response regulator CckA